MVVGLDRPTVRAAGDLADRCHGAYSHQWGAHDALRQLAATPSERWTVVVPDDLVDLDVVTFVMIAREILGNAGTIVVAGVDHVSARASLLVDMGATICLAAPRELDHPSVALGSAA